MAKVGVVLAGCGVYDGSEIHESVITLLALDRADAEIVCMAPNAEQLHVVNHLTGEVAEGESRNILVESARIARGNIKDIATVSAADLDALVIPGGFGAAKNLCDFAVNGPDCQVNPEVSRLVMEVVDAKKPLAAICISPAVIARILGQAGKSPQVTIGNDSGTAEAINAMGAQHVNKAVEEFVVDENLNILTTPAYMLAGSIKEAADGIEATITALMARL
ncbi:isoprenoid biosynthesis glyoxalase ElbB [Desulfuromonas acetoxidans]|uniref:ThiJ/PfpI n=1 Tax=Desulfuromonas acetoxidans (strain DSM 684 / 11070) TaxID=281689 RepID=Q1K1X2_DESA6|nr:isoprenoid biosynthesis glyoxalase ElbB [Desulfuromonas acetoxidans]EAT16667.1 ThiJ/PfpI [Desulfuromonas acetoxidans DSM 684]MBF0647122.1 isoprenoid biosynthesis glyoxalase ElbB [Desulfuromonas acetoxidans]NVD24778.1 isoprenoid biosynthesis glyoxalase ElbB [Desulfuromonas acetoxidans]NVE16823.1 isoprenoid biosynthesis glyoxalase ElbB [Desulfuromonas acetoxidans]